MLYDNKYVQEYVKNKKEELKSIISKFNSTPCLAIVQVGNNPASNSYIKGKLKDCEEVGIKTHLIKIEETEDTTAIGYHLELIVDELNKDDEVHGIIVQLPLPNGVIFDFNSIDPKKDVDGFSKDTWFVPCTPLGVVKFLQDTDYNFEGKNILVLGRSATVGKPLAKMLTDLDATVTLAHSKTQFTVFNSDYDLIISCANCTNLFNQLEYTQLEYAYGFQAKNDEYVSFSFKEGYIDVALEKDYNNKLCGNFNKEEHNDMLKELEKYKLEDKNIYAISGIGGVGLLTRLTLMENVLNAFEVQNEI